MANKRIRAYAKKKGIQHYLIAEELKIQESAFSKLLRKELDTEKQKQIMVAIDKIYNHKHPERQRKKECPVVECENSLFKELLNKS